MTTVCLTYTWTNDDKFQPECAVLALKCLAAMWSLLSIKQEEKNRHKTIRLLKFTWTWDKRLTTGTVPGKPDT